MFRSFPVEAASFTGLATAGSLMLAGVVSAPVYAEWPDVINAMPNDAQMVMATKSLTDLEKNWNAFAAATGIPAESWMAVRQGMGDTDLSPILESNLLNEERAMGFAVMKSAWQEVETPPIMLFVPVEPDKFAEWVEASYGEMVDGKLAAIDLGADRTWYAKPVAKYTVLSPDRNLVTNFTAPPTAGESRWKELVGEHGETVADNNDFVLLIDTAGLDEVLLPKLREQMEGMGEMAAMMGGPDAAEQMQQNINMQMDMLQFMLRETSAMAFGTRFTGDGMMADMSMAWKPESRMAAFMPEEKKARNLLSAFPNEPFLMAMSADVEGTDVAAIFDKLTEMMPAAMRQNQAMQLGAGDLWKNADGFAMVVYPSPAGIMGGLMSQGAQVYTGDGKALQEAFRTTLTAMNGQQQNGIQYTVELQQNVKEIKGASIDSYRVRMKFPPEMMQAQQMMTYLYGPMGGPNGFIVGTEDALIMTLSRNEEMLRKVVAGLQGGPEAVGLDDNKTLGSMHRFLPNDPEARMYFSLGDFAAPFAPMIGLDPATLSGLPPIAMAATMSKEGMMGSFVLPAPVIQTGVNVGMQMGGAMGVQRNRGGEEPPLF